MRRLTFLVLASALIGLAPAHPLVAAGRTFYVSPSGSNANPGTAAKPFRTIQWGVNAARPGDSVLVGEGTYTATSFPLVELRRGGARGSPLTVAAAPGATPVLRGTPEYRYGIILDPGVSYVTIAGLEFENFSGDAIQLACDACSSDVEHRNVRVRGVEVSGGGTAFRPTNGARIWVLDSWFHDNDEVGIDCAPGPCNQLTVARTRLERHTGYDWSDGLAVERGRGILVVDSLARQNAGDGFDSKASDTRVLRSRSLDNARDGIKLWEGDSEIRDSISAGNGLTSVVLESGGTFVLANSLVADGGAAERSYGMTVAYDGGPATTFRMFNTIFAANNGTALYLGGQVTLAREDHDLFATGGDENSAIVYKGKDYSEADLNDGTWRRSSGLGRGTFAASPAFQGAGDYHLRAGSPGVDDGTASGASAIFRQTNAAHHASATSLARR